MTLALPQPFVLACTGTSLTEGKLAAFPVGWVQRLMAELPLQPEAIGQVIVLPFGHGGWTSADILAEAPALSAQRPNHILAESGDVNDCVVTGGVPAISRAGKISNMNAMVFAWLANNPAVDITFQTMNPVGAAGGTLRPNYVDYKNDTLANAAILGCGIIDHWPDWTNPIPDWQTNAFDQLHPVWANAFETVAYRKILFWCRQKMAAWWGLSAPVAPTYPTAPDINYLLIAGGGAGGDGAIGGGGGAGGILRGMDYAANLLGAFSIGAAGAISSGAPGGNGGDTTLGGYRAVGGGGGGGYSADASASRGRDGGSSGGAASFAALHGPGAPRLGQGFQGGFCDPGSNNGAGAGGGCTTPGANGVGVNGGLGGLGWTTDVPGDPRDVCGGGPGGQFSGARSAYGLGGGPTKFGGGGQGAGSSGSGNDADNGGIGVGYIWYPGAARYTGGAISSSGGFTVHKLTGTGALA